MSVKRDMARCDALMPRALRVMHGPSRVAMVSSIKAKRDRAAMQIGRHKTVR